MRVRAQLPISRPTETTILTPQRKLLLCAGDFGFNLYWQTSSIFLLYFYTDVIGLSAVVAGSLYMVALVWDAVTDPVIGYVSDRTRSSLGRYRPFLIFGAPPLALAFCMMFLTPSGSTTAAAVAIGVTQILFRTIYGVVSIPYTALFARVTRDSNVRADLAGFRMVFAMLSAVLVSAATLPLVETLGGGDDRKGWAAMAVCYGLLGTVLLWLTAGAAKGLDAPETNPPLRIPFRDTFHSIVVNRPLQIALGAVLITSFTSTFFNKNIIYYFKYVLNAEEDASFALTLMALITACAVPVWAWLARIRGKRFSWMGGLCFFGLGLIAWYISNTNVTHLYLALSLIATGAAASYVSFWAIAPDTVEYGEWRTGTRTESLIFGLVVFGQKAALGLGAGALGMTLQTVGYNANGTQTAETLQGLRTMMFLVPTAGVALALFLLVHYRLDRLTHARMVREIAARENSGNTQA
jgi:GPH family glycoside/pentoside/hexuronide:cation symporter